MLVGGRFGSIQAGSVKRTHKWVCHVVPDEPFDSSQVDERGYSVMLTQPEPEAAQSGVAQMRQPVPVFVG